MQAAKDLNSEHKAANPAGTPPPSGTGQKGRRVSTSNTISGFLAAQGVTE